MFANPDFDLGSGQTIAQLDGKSSNSVAPTIMRGSEKRELEDLRFLPLEGTEKEGEILNKDLRRLVR